MYGVYVAVPGHTYLGVGAAAGDGVAAVAVGALGRHVGVFLDGNLA